MRHLIIILNILIFSYVNANSSGKNMIVREYSTENGLLHNTVYSAMKDADGFLWFGTWYGLTSFDAVKFKNYNSRNDYNTDIPPHKIQTIIEASDGNLWVKTIDHKLYLFDKKNELFFDVFNEIKKKYAVSSKIIKIELTGNGNLLLLTKNKDLLEARSLGNGKMDVELLYDSKSKREKKLTNNLLVEEKNHIDWIGVDFKIISCRKGKDIQDKASDIISKKLNKSGQQIFTAAFRWKNMLWLGNSNGVIYKIDVNKGEVLTINSFQGKGSISNLISTANGNIVLVAVRGSGIYELNVRTGDSFLAVKTSADQTITNAFIDSYEKIWFIADESDVIYYDQFNRHQKTFDLPTGLVSKTIKFQDGKDEGMFFLSTSGDVINIHSKTLVPFVLNNHPELMIRDEKRVFLDLNFDRDNILWLTSTSHGIFKINFPKDQFNLIFFPSKPEIPLADRAVKTMFQSKNGEIWVASRREEVYLLDATGNLKKTYNKSNFNFGNVYHIMEDHAGNLWFSTKGSGLIKAEKNPKSPLGYAFTRFTYDEKNPSSISGNDVYFTLEDSQRRIWVALFGGGLNLLTEDKGKTVFYNRYNSFANYPKLGLYMEVRSLAEDKNGRMWVGTSDGLMSFSGNFKNPEQIQFEIYRNELNNSNMFDNDVYVLFKDASSQIWMSVFGGGLNKMLHYDEDKNMPVFKSYGVNQGLKSDIILSLTEDDDNALWLATENAITRFDKEKETFRNFDRYDGLHTVQMEEVSAIKLNSGKLMFGTRRGILTFDPQKIETYNSNYVTFIVDFWVSNRDLKSFDENPILRESIKFAKKIVLKHDQSSFAIEFAALNFYNQNRVSYKYILEGFEDDWHFNAKNRIASYPNIPPGKYTFRVHTVDEANIGLKSEKSIDIVILPPWWLTWWAKTFYFLLAAVALFFGFRAMLIYIKMRNEMYVEQRVAELKIKFFTNISHELRTPLTLIMGPIQELRQKQNLNEKGLQYVGLIEKNARQMLQLVNQILDFRKIQNGKMILHLSKINLNEIIQSLHDEFRVMAEENEISFIYQTTDEEYDLWADKEKVETVVRNLLSNAFKYTQPGGSIFISCGLAENGTKCFVRVEDTGVGIPQNKVSEIFERFFQDENSMSAQYPGTGIGLALSKEIVNLHHGHIHVESNKDKGSVFTMELLPGKEHFKSDEVNFYAADTRPADEITEELPATDMEVEELDISSDTNKPTLLVVEDNKDMRNLLHLQLDDHFRVITAVDGVDGLKKVHLHQPDIIITDQMMPEMTGTEMLEQIRNDFQISHIPVIMLTAKSDDESKIKAIHVGANVYITKPFNIEYLIACIEQLLIDRKMFREKIWNQEQVVEKNEAEDTYENYLQQKDFQFLEKIHQVIDENLDNSDFNIDSIADTLGISRSAFFKKLKSLTGLAPVDFIKEYRLSKSLEMLKNTDMTISEVAFAVGFRESGYYGKCFRKKYEQTPSEYINKYRKKA